MGSSIADRLYIPEFTEKNRTRFVGGCWRECTVWILSHQDAIVGTFRLHGALMNLISGSIVVLRFGVFGCCFGLSEAHKII